MVFASIYPTENEDFERLRESLKKLQLNDAALVFEPESSEAFGQVLGVGSWASSYGHH